MIFAVYSNNNVNDGVSDLHGGFTLALFDSLFSKGLRTVKSIPPKGRLGFFRVLKVAIDKVICKPGDISCWVSLLALPLCLLKSFRLRSNLECKSAIKRQRQKECIVNAIRSWGTPGGSFQLLRETLAESSPTFLDVNDDDLDLGERNIKQCKRKICDGHYTAAVRVLSSSSVAPYSEATLEDLKTKHPFHPAPSLPHVPNDHHHFIASSTVFWTESRVSLMARLVDGMMLGEYIASAPLTPLVKPGGGIRPIVVGTVWRRLVSKVSAIMIGHSLNGYLDGLQFGVGVTGGSEAILHSVNRLIEAYRDDVGLSMLLVDFKNAFNLVDREVMLREVRLHFPAISRWLEFCYSNPARLYYGEHTLWSCQGVQQGDPLGLLLFSLVLHPLICKIRDSFILSLHAWYLDDGTIVGDTMVVGKVLELIMEDGSGCGLHLNVDKTEVFWPKEDPRSRLAGIFPPNIARPLHGVKLLGGPASVDFDFCNDLVKKRVAKTVGLMDAIAKINDHQCELLLLRSCTGISKLYFTMRTCPPCFFKSAQCSFDVALRSSLKHIVTASGPGFGDWQWRLATLRFTFRGIGVYSTDDVLNNAFLASRLQSADLQTKLLWHTGDVDLSKDKSGPESPPEFHRSWYVEGHVMSRVISSVLAQQYLRTIRQRYSPREGPQSMLGDEGLSSGGSKLNSIFIIAEVTFTKPKQPTEEEFQGVGTRDAGTETHGGTTEPVLQTQKTPSPSPAFIKENIDVLRTMIKEHDQQAKIKATPRKLAYVDSNKEAPAMSLARGFSDRFSLGSSGISDTHRKTHSTS
ncbi:putative reverse transcriptase domain-containing protein [Tanacetum coccineum]